MSHPPSVPAEDKAWVEIVAPVDMRTLRTLCDDLECLFRINPYLDFKVWRGAGPDRFHIEMHNNSNDQELALDLTRTRNSDTSFSVQYAQGLKAITQFELSATPQGSKLVITDDYNRLPQNEREQRINEVDRSLEAWGRDIYEYLMRYKRWGWFAPWRWYMRRVWTPMTPMARRVVWMVILVDVAFFGLFLFVMLIYWIEFE
jgi:hypothetical protein